MAQDVNIALNFPADIFLTSDEDPSRSESKKRGQENKVDLTNSKDIFELSDDNVGNAAFMDVDNEERNKPKDENKANLSQNIFLSDGEDVISNTSIDIFENCESCSCFDNDVAIKPIGDVVPKKPDTPEPSAPEPMEIDYDPQPGPSNLNKSIYIPYAQPPTSIYHAEQEEDILSDNIDISQDLLTDQNILNNAEVEEPPSKIPHLLNTTTEEVRLQKTLQKLREDTANEGRHFGRYMQLKKDKLRYQVNVISRVDTVVSNIFEGVSIFINGHTDPSALELRELIQTHGGQYHCYMEYGITTYTIASSLASAKIDKSRKDEIFLLPGWIIDSIAAGERLAIDEYRLVEETKEKRAPITIFFGKRNETPAPPQREKTLDARDPNFIQEFYARSRLHLISTLAQDMKDFMMNLRETGNLTTEEWDKTNFPVAEISITGPIVFHIDMDSFFVSVALRNRPDLIDKPIAITHSKGSASAPGFSEVASVSYAARKLGLKNGMLIRDALKLCPKLVCLPYQFDAYREVSKQIYILVAKYTLEVRAVSCDEMYVNFSKICSERKIGDPIALANHIRGRIKEETGCPASVGIGHNMLLARLSTRKAKPDGVYWCRKKDSVKFVANEKLENIPGVGYHTMNKLKDRFGIVEHCGDLQNIHIDDLGDIFGKKSAEHLYKRCRGEDDSMQDFISSSERKSVSCDINYGIRFTKKEEATDFLKRVVEEVCKKLTSCRRLTGAVTLKLLIRSSDAPIETPKYLGCGRCDSITKTALLKKSSDDVQWIFKEILTLYDSVHPVTTDLRGVGIHCGRLVPADPGVRRLQVVKDFFVPNKAAAPRNRKLDVDEPRKTEKIETEVKVWMQMPKFRQCTTMAETKIELRSVLLEDPNKKHVKEVGRFLFHLQKYGAYDSLRKYIIYLGQLQSDRDIQDMWIEALEVIFERLDTKVFWRTGARFVKKELATNPLVNNQCPNICTCPDSFDCWCETKDKK